MRIQLAGLLRETGARRLSHISLWYFKNLKSVRDALRQHLAGDRQTGAPTQKLSVRTSVS